MIPDGVQFPLHIACIRGDGDHCVLVWHNNNELTASSVGAIGVVPAAPELKAIPFYPVGADLSMAFLLVIDLFRGSLLDPLTWN